MICSTFIATPQSYGQTWDVILSDALGNPQVVSWPPPDTSYYPNKVIIKFKRSALNLENLCYSYGFDDNLSNNDKKVEKPMSYLTYNQKIYLHSQRFTPHQVTTDSLLANAMLMRGIDSLKRLTSANPCEDTISISILGDTVVCEDYLFFEANITNDTSVISTCTLLTMFFQNSLFYVEPNYIPIPCGVPSDPRYVNQKAFHPNLMDIESAWDVEVGIQEIQIGIVDDGIEYDKCEFNRIDYIGPGYKVAYGFNYSNSQDVAGIKRVPWHGTGCGSLAAALTNHHTSFCHDGMAGVAGGWGQSNSIRGIGCELYALKAVYYLERNTSNVRSGNFIGAIRESSSRNPLTGYGNQVDILNISWSLGGSQSLNEAIHYAFVNNINVVASRGNFARSDTIYDSINDTTYIFPGQNDVTSLARKTDDFLVFPASFEEHVVSCVGAAGETNPNQQLSLSHIKDRVGYSNFGRTLDFLISTGERYHNPVNDLNIWNLISDSAAPGYKETGGWEQADGTSASAGIASGIIGLLRSYAVRNGLFYTLEPEDYEGIMKASVEDVVGTRIDPYTNDFDIYSGWGHVNVGNAISMLQNGYRIFKSSTQAVTYGNWQDHPLKGTPNFKFVFAKDTKWNDSLNTGKYKLKIRQVTGQLVTPNNIDYFEPIYSWGVSGRNGSSGWSLGNPQIQTGYSVILGNQGGNSLLPGIIHHRGGNYTQSGIFEASTFQYAILDSNDFIVSYLPPIEMLGVNVSIFAKQLNPMSVAKGNTEESLIVYPSIANEAVNIQWKELVTSNCQVRIRSLLGEIVSYVDIEPIQSLTPISIDVSKLPIGSYFVEIVTGSKVHSYKIMIVR